MLLDLKKIFLSEDESLNTQYQLNLSDLSFNGINPLKTPVSVSAEIKNSADVVTVGLTVEFSYSAPCDRCGEDTVTDFSLSFEHTLVQSLVGENDGDYIEIPDLQLDLDELVTSDIILSLPTKYLCREDCKGLCPNCGKNLNKGSCGCDTHQTDPRLEVLKQLL